MKQDALFGGILLPPELSDEETQKLLIANDKHAREILIEHNLRFVIYIAKKFQNTEIPMEDLVAIGSLGLVKAVNSFDINKKSKLVTYACKCIENEILMYLRRERKWRNLSSLEDPLCIDDKGNELLISDICMDPDSYTKLELLENRDYVSRYLTMALNSLSNRDVCIFLYRLGKVSQSEMEHKLGIGQSYISRILKKINKKLEKLEAKNSGNEKITFFINDSYCFGFSKECFPDFNKLFECRFNFEFESNSKFVTVNLPKCKKSFVAVADFLSNY